jgi:hypothetical protein
MLKMEAAGSFETLISTYQNYTAPHARQQYSYNYITMATTATQGSFIDTVNSSDCKVSSDRVINE